MSEPRACAHNVERIPKLVGKTEDFYEIELNVKGLKTLDDSLDDYLTVEELNGDNQYFCESCRTRVTRSIKLRSLPAVLNFQLKRCVFLPKTTMKKKITSAFSFPGELNMQQRLSEPSQLDLIYNLSAVLIHKGTAVNSGHYIALIKDENTGQWWEFDDEHVSTLGHHPFGEGSSSNSSKGVSSEPLVYPSSTEETNGDNVKHINVQLQSSESSNNGHVKRFTSNDAYMLMYNLKPAKQDGEKKHTAYDVKNIQLEGNTVFSHDGVSLPSHLCEEIRDLNVSYLDACEQYKLKKQRELDCITERRQEVRSVLTEAPVRSLAEPFYWVSTDWLRQWADNILPPVLDNSSIQCSHGKVPVSKVGSMKRLSSKAWNLLFSKNVRGPTLTNDDYCMTCLFDGARTVVFADTYRDRRKSMKEVVDSMLSGKLDGTYYVSKAWLQQWTKRKNLDAPSEADSGPTASIRCLHGQLMPKQATGAKRVLILESL